MARTLACRAAFFLSGATAVLVRILSPMTLATLFFAGTPPDDAFFAVREDRAGVTGVVSQALSVPDAAIVAAVRAGDERAFEQIYARHYAPMVAFAAPYIHDVDAAHELVSD